jgi:hypothetical protein
MGHSYVQAGILTLAVPAPVLCFLQNMAKATYGNEPAPIPCSAFNHDGNIYAYALSYDWSRGFQVRSCVCASLVALCWQPASRERWSELWARTWPCVSEVFLSHTNNATANLECERRPGLA